MFGWLSTVPVRMKESSNMFLHILYWYFIVFEISKASHTDLSGYYLMIPIIRVILLQSVRWKQVKSF